MNIGMFLKNKIERQLKMNGEDFTFYRNKLDKYGQPITDEFEEILSIKGIWHEETIKSNSSYGISDSTDNWPKKRTLILCKFEDILGLKIGDFTYDKNNKKYAVVCISIVDNLNVVADITIEVENNGQL